MLFLIDYIKANEFAGTLVFYKITNKLRYIQYIVFKNTFNNIQSNRYLRNITNFAILHNSNELMFMVALPVSLASINSRPVFRKSQTTKNI